MKPRATVLVLFAVVPIAAFAQSTQRASPQAPSAGTPAAQTATSAQSEPSAAKLLSETMSLDIDTASYYELLAWCRRVGLPDTGSKTDLQRRLRAFYKLPAEKSSAGAKPKTRVITIRSADTTEYFTIEKIGQKYIRLSGGVTLKMYDPATNSTHTITADTILFNQSEKTITATGHLEYDLTGKGKTEVFRGESLTFNVDSWAGIFFNGISESQKTVNGNKVTYFYSGTTIRRSAKDVVTLSSGTITSSDSLEPDFKVTATRIWVLAPGEWALKNAVLYVGRVPLLYLPFFFYPGDNLVFNPSFGYRPEEGYFLQTTTYLIGKKKESGGSLSFLQVAEDSDETYNEEVRGLFLHKETGSETKPTPTPYNAQTSYIKIMADIYSRLGVFGGIAGEMDDWGLVKQLDFEIDAARSRDIYIDPITGAYSQFWEQPDGSYASDWNESDLFGSTLPLRYGMNFKLNAGNSVALVTASIPYYSDPYFVRDFGRREESVDWSSLLGVNQNESVEPSGETTDPASLLLSTLTWTVHGQLNVDPGPLKPYVTTASVTSADFAMYWNTQYVGAGGVQGAGVPGLDPTLPNYVPPEYRSDFFEPGQQFFYPNNYIFPNLSLKVGGTLFGTPPPPPAAPAPGGTSPPAGTASPPAQAGGATSQAAPASPSEGSGAPDASAPWEETNTASQGGEKTKVDLRVPGLRDDIDLPAVASSSTYEQSLTYTLLPNFSIQNQTISTNWYQQSDINLSDAYAIMTAGGTGTLQYTGAYLGNLATISDALTFSANYQTHFNENEQVAADWSSFVLQDEASTFFDISNAATLTSMPLMAVDMLKTSLIRYQLTTDLYHYGFASSAPTPSFETSYLAWDPDHITVHSVTLNLNATPWNNQIQEFNVNEVLPPLAPEIDPQLVLQTGPLTSTWTGSIYQPSPTMGWQPKPLTAEEKLVLGGWLTIDEQADYDFLQGGWTTSTSSATISTIDKNISLQQSLTYDLLGELPIDSTTKLNLWFFNAEFDAQQTTPYEFIPGLGWEAQTATSFVPSNLSAGINYTYKSQPLWKNRINFSASFVANWNVDLLQVTQNMLDVQFNTTLSIYKFLDLNFSVESTNQETYRYFPVFANEVGQSTIDPLTDLLDSFDFFDTEEREESNFKMKSIALNLVHHMGDWDLSLQYSGSPQLTTTATGAEDYQWTPTLTILVQWKPVPEIKTNIQSQYGTLTY